MFLCQLFIVKSNKLDVIYWYNVDLCQSMYVLLQQYINVRIIYECSFMSQHDKRFVQRDSSQLQTATRICTLHGTLQA